MTKTEDTSDNMHKSRISLVLTFRTPVADFQDLALVAQFSTCPPPAAGLLGSFFVYLQDNY